MIDLAYTNWNKRGIYLHIPFCEHICSYCDFFVDKNINQIDEYVNLLIKEIEIDNKINQEIEICSLYFGGGTPSLLTPIQFDKILNSINSRFTISCNCEISIESNPTSLSPDKLLEYKSLGINRISCGVQSFNKHELGVLKRNHSPKKAIKALEEIKRAGIDNVNLDIIFSIPGQTLNTLKKTLDIAIGLGTTHFSAYSLIFEENTPLYKRWKQGKIIKVEDEQDAYFYEFVIDYLLEHGFQQYEVSNFAKDKQVCHHNLHSWNSGEYYAYGVSSHGYIDGIRYSNHRNLKLYNDSIQKSKLPVGKSEILSEAEKLEEFIFLAIRANGIDLKEFENRFKIDLVSKLSNTIKALNEKCLIKIENGRLYLTKQGYKICDSITFKLIDELQKRDKH